LAKDQPAEITMFQISEVQESPAFNGRRSFLTLRVGQTDGDVECHERLGGLLHYYHRTAA